jgi:hypothetical protein
LNMARGKSRTEFFGGIGLVTSQTAVSWEDVYRVSTVKDPKWNIGDLGVMPDGRKFRYCLSTGQCDTFIGNIFVNSIGTGAGDVGIDWSTLAASSAVGDMSVSMTAPSTRAIAEDALRGGLISLNIGSGTNNDTQQMRLITGNSAAAASGTCVIYLDAPLVTALTAGTAYGYCMPSPYSAVQGAQIGTYNGWVSFVGYAAAPVSTSGLYHWEQTAGQISASLYGSAVGKTQYMRDVVFRYDGNLIHRGATGATGLEAQRAGYIMDNNNAANGATVIMLQLEP